VPARLTKKHTNFLTLRLQQKTCLNLNFGMRNYIQVERSSLPPTNATLRLNWPLPAGRVVTSPLIIIKISHKEMKPITFWYKNTLHVCFLLGRVHSNPIRSSLYFLMTVSCPPLSQALSSDPGVRVDEWPSCDLSSRDLPVKQAVDRDATDHCPLLIPP
jgi:hypothetical protein